MLVRYMSVYLSRRNIGVPKKRLYGSYADSHRCFSFWVDSSAKLINIAWQIGQQTK